MEDQSGSALKVYKHHQHTRVQKEREDMWISSEDLRTEGSSDEETPAATRGRRVKKNRKQRKHALVLSPPRSTSSLTSTSSSHCTEIKDYTTSTEIEKSTIETNIDMTSTRFPTMDSQFFTDLHSDAGACACAAPSTSGISLASSDSGMDALNLESRWRPKRGSLKYPILVEGTSVEV